MKLSLEIKDIHDPIIFVEILELQKKYYGREMENVGYLECPRALQNYYSYLDRDERSALEVRRIKSLDAWYAEYNDDRFIMCGDVSAGAPYVSQDYFWLFTQGEESLRFELDLECLLNREE